LAFKTHIWCISGFVLKIGYYNKDVFLSSENIEALGLEEFVVSIYRVQWWLIEPWKIKHSMTEVTVAIEIGSLGELHWCLG